MLSIDTRQERVTLEVARDAMAAVAPKLARLLRSVPDQTVSSVGSWTVGDVAAHVAHVVSLDLEAARGAGAEASLAAQGVTPPPAISELHHMTAALLNRDTVRDPSVQATRVEEGIAALVDACAEGDRFVPWLLGATLSRASVCSHQVLEMLVHGWDIARAAGLAWTIPPDLACVAIEGFIVPMIDEIGGGNAGQTISASCEVRLRGGGRFVLGRTGVGVAVLPRHDRVDVHLDADPEAMLLAILGRAGSRLSRVARGKIVPWGRHPIRGLRVFDGIKAS